MELLTDAEIEAALVDLPDWTREGDALTRTFRLNDFVHAVDFVNVVAEAAETLGHHPDIDIRYNKVTLRLSTHSAGGLTAKDIELAQRIEHQA
jgi:4a-hydroxytetrahydrobiopterin dehydratase